MTKHAFTINGKFKPGQKYVMKIVNDEIFLSVKKV